MSWANVDTSTDSGSRNAAQLDGTYDQWDPFLFTIHDAWSKLPEDASLVGNLSGIAEVVAASNEISDDFQPVGPSDGRKTPRQESSMESLQMGLGPMAEYVENPDLAHAAFSALPKPEIYNDGEDSLAILTGANNPLPTVDTIFERRGPTQANTMVGSAYATSEPDIFIFKCCDSRCVGKTFGRWYDLKRHHDGTHAVQKPAFWCHMPGCKRNIVAGGRSFPRKDKLRDHLRKMHA
ncbi:hypothetical protein NX059_002323 [Plenodomus lindquistii]|nr:hypothetical protein NX059_002323 [Plenodomus lindquistii]